MKGKKIAVGITGSIAAYKSAILVRLFVKAGAEVRVIMTPSASQFIAPLTLAVLSKNPVLIDNASNGNWNNHVEAGLWADALAIAPASANTMAKMAAGICDNLLLTSYLSARGSVFLAPAMDLDMWRHPSAVHNLALLRQRGTYIIEPAFGELASGLEGRGRMAEPTTIFNCLEKHFSGADKLSGKKVLITAGPTYEAIDPVRFIGNHSSGKMGFAIAEAMAMRGARVNLVAGPVQLPVPSGVDCVRVQSAEEMLNACLSVYPETDIAILSAAVADYKPEKTAAQKIKKEHAEISIPLTSTPDIAAALGKQKKENQLLIGFALETENETENARRKILSKNFDFIVLNSLRDKGAGFGYDTNKITIINAKNESKKFDLKSKTEVAHDIVNEIIEMLHA